MTDNHKRHRIFGAAIVLAAAAVLLFAWRYRSVAGPVGVGWVNHPKVALENVSARIVVSGGPKLGHTRHMQIEFTAVNLTPSMIEQVTVWVRMRDSDGAVVSSESPHFIDALAGNEAKPVSFQFDVEQYVQRGATPREVELKIECLGDPRQASR